MIGWVEDGIEDEYCGLGTEEEENIVDFSFY